MTLAASDLVWYGSANMDEADGSTQGGAIDTTTRIVFDDPTDINSSGGSIGVLDYLSSNSADNSQNVTVTGRDTTGAVVTEQKTLNGTTVVTGTVVFQRILKIVISASHAGTVSVKKHTGSVLLCAIESGVLQVRRIFYNVAADISSGSARNFYEKVFLKNTNGSFAALGLQFKTNTNVSGGGDVQLAVESSVGGSGTSTNRQTAPAGITGAGFGDGPTPIPGTDLAPGAAIGVWFNLNLPAGTAAGLTTYTPEADCSHT